MSPIIYLKRLLFSPTVKPGQVWQYGTAATNIRRNPFAAPYTCFPIRYTVIEVKSGHMLYETAYPDGSTGRPDSGETSHTLRYAKLISSPHAEDADYLTDVKDIKP